MTTTQLVQKTGDVDNRIETIAKLLAYGRDVDIDVHRRIAKGWFLSGHGDYYLRYVVRRRKDIRRIVVSPNYVVVEIKSRASSVYDKYYIIGVDYDSDMLFMNRVGFVDMFGFYTTKIQHINNTTIVYTNDDAIKRDVFNYDHDVTDQRFSIDKTGRYRVQGDIVFDVSELDLDSQIPAWAMHEIYRYVRYLVLDKIAALLNDYGISYVVGQIALDSRNSVFGLAIVGGSDSSRKSKYSERNRWRVIKILSEYFDMSCRDHWSFTSCTIKLTIDKMPVTAGIEIRSDARFGNHIGNTVVVVREAGDWETVNMLARDIVEQFHALQTHDVIRQIGNHRIELHRVIPIRFAYEPRIRPLVLEPQTLYIVVNDTYIVDNDTLIELTHKEHGQRYIWFDRKYVLRIGRVQVHPDDVAERNRVILGYVEPYKSQQDVV